MVSWIIGVSSGALGAPFVFFALIAGGSIWCFAALRIGKQAVVASAALLLLGHVYGVDRLVSLAAPCAFEEGSEAYLARTYSLSPTQARYVFTRDDGCSLLVYAHRYPVLVRGTTARIFGEQELPHDAFSFLPEYASALVDDGITLVVRNANLENIREGDHMLDRMRIRTMDALVRLFPEPDSSLFIAMLAGDQGMVLPSMKDAYRRSGIIHILSISGMHISLIALMATAIIGALPLRSSVRSGIILALLWCYIAGVGFPESAIRAGVFWTLYVIAYRAHALIGVSTVVLLTLCVLVTLHPPIIQSIGFELSVAAVSGIAIALFLQKQLMHTQKRNPVITLLVVSAGATLATAPLTLHYFGTLSLLGLVANMLVVPLLPILMYGALASVMLVGVLPALSMVTAYCAHLLMSWIVFVATAIARIPYGYVENAVFPLWAVGVFYALLLGGILVVMKVNRISARQLWV